MKRLWRKGRKIIAAVYDHLAPLMEFNPAWLMLITIESGKKQLTIIPSIFHVDIPIDLSDAIQHVASTAEMEQIRAEWLINQSLELKKAGVTVLHYYTLGKPAVIRKVLEGVF